MLVADAVAHVRAQFADIPEDDWVHIRAFQHFTINPSSPPHVLGRAAFQGESVFALTIPHHVLSRDVAYYIGVRRWIPNDMLASAVSSWCPRQLSVVTDEDRNLSRETVDLRCIRMHDVVSVRNMMEFAVAAVFAADTVTTLCIDEWYSVELPHFLPHLHRFPFLRELRTTNAAYVMELKASRALDNEPLVNTPDTSGAFRRCHRISRVAIPASRVDKGHRIFFSRHAQTTPLSLSSDDDVGTLEAVSASHTAATSQAAATTNRMQQCPFVWNTASAQEQHQSPLNLQHSGLEETSTFVDTALRSRHGKFGRVKIFLSGVHRGAGVRREMLVTDSTQIPIDINPGTF